MKQLLLALISLSIVNIASAKQVEIDQTQSSIEWLGQKKVPGGDHNGTVKIKKGTVNLNEKKQLTGGTLVIDMTTIENKDLSGEWKKKLETHLNSADFFDTANNKEASFKITKVEATRSNLQKVTGNLTLRGKTHPETFEIKVEKAGKTMIATGTVAFDRNKYGVTYNSEASVLKKAIKIAKDKVIKDKIKLTLKLVTKTI